MGKEANPWWWWPSLWTYVTIHSYLFPWKILFLLNVPASAVGVETTTPSTLFYSLSLQLLMWVLIPTSYRCTGHKKVGKHCSFLVLSHLRSNFLWAWGHKRIQRSRRQSGDTFGATRWIPWVPSCTGYNLWCRSFTTQIVTAMLLLGLHCQSQEDITDVLNF